MTIRVRAAVLRAPHSRLSLETLDLADPGPDEVRVRYGASGVCHSDLHCIDGEWTVPLPLVLGHEGAGTVEAIGPGVTGLAPGDAAVLSWRYACGRCRACVRGRSWACSETRMGDCTLDDGTLRFRGDDGAGRVPVPLGRDVRRGGRGAGLGRGADPGERAVRGRVPDRLLGHDGRRRGRQHRARGARRIGMRDRVRRRRPLRDHGRGARGRAPDHRRGRRGREARAGARPRRDARRARRRRRRRGGRRRSSPAASTTRSRRSACARRSS